MSKIIDGKKIAKEIEKAFPDAKLEEVKEEK